MMNFSPDSKVWFYTSNIQLSDSQALEVGTSLKSFCESWTSHDKQLKATYQIHKNRIIILIVDSSATMASGCSIDKSVHHLKALGAKMNIDFFNRAELLFDEEASIISYPITEIQAQFENGNIESNSMIYNLNIEKLSEMEQHFLIPFHAHWMYKRIKQTEK